MNKQKLTPWFPETVKPIREGLYELKIWVMPNAPAGHLHNCAYWDGEVWRYAINRSSIKHYPGQWRGLAKDPS